MGNVHSMKSLYMRPLRHVVVGGIQWIISCQEIRFNMHDSKHIGIWSGGHRAGLDSGIIGDPSVFATSG